MAGQRVSRTETVDGEIAEHTPFKRLVQEMAFRARMESDDNSARVYGVEAILVADDDEEMWSADERENIGGRDLAGVEQRVLSFLVKRSRTGSEIAKNPFQDEQGVGLYLEVTSIRLEDGVEFIWNTSAPNVVAKLWWLMKHDRLPADVVIVAVDLGGGQAVLKLKPIPKRAVSSDVA